VSTEDDDPAAEWAGVPKTLPDGQITPASGLDTVIEEARKRGQKEGCAACFPKGQEDAIAAVERVMRWHGMTDAEIRPIIAAVRAELTKLLPVRPALPKHEG